MGKKAFFRKVGQVLVVSGTWAYLVFDLTFAGGFLTGGGAALLGSRMEVSPERKARSFTLLQNLRVSRRKVWHNSDVISLVTCAFTCQRIDHQ